MLAHQFDVFYSGQILFKVLRIPTCWTCNLQFIKEAIVYHVGLAIYVCIPGGNLYLPCFVFAWGMAFHEQGSGATWTPPTARAWCPTRARLGPFGVSLFGECPS